MSASVPGWRVPLYHRVPALAWAVLLVLGACTASPVQGVRVEAADVVSQAPSPIARDRQVPGRWIEVRLNTGDDLGRFRRDNAMGGIWSQTSLCTEGRFDPRRRLANGGVSDAARRGEAALNDGLNSLPDSKGRYTYFLYLRTRTLAWQPSAADDDDRYVAHDLSWQPDSVCLRFGGGSFLYGGRHRSDTILIPYPLIAAALARAGLPHAAVP